MSRPGFLSAGRDSACGPAERQREDERERGEMDPEGRREPRDKTWLSLASGNYLHDKATAGNRSGIADKTEDKGPTGLKKFFWFTITETRERFECVCYHSIPD